MVYKAIKNFEKEERNARRNPDWRPLVFICSTNSGNVKRNVLMAQQYCRDAVEKGYLPIAPHMFSPVSW